MDWLTLLAYAVGLGLLMGLGTLALRRFGHIPISNREPVIVGGAAAGLLAILSKERDAVTVMSIGLVIVIGFFVLKIISHKK